MGLDIIDTIDEALSDWTVSADAMRWTPDSAAVTPDPSPVQVLLDLDFRPFVEAMQRAAKQVAKIMTPLVRSIDRRMERQAAKQHRPIALRIDGHEYRRRQRARKGRR